MAKTIIFTGLIVGFAYATEFFIAWYSRNPVEILFRWRPPVAHPFLLDHGHVEHHQTAGALSKRCGPPLPGFLEFPSPSTSVCGTSARHHHFHSCRTDFLPNTWVLPSRAWCEFGIMLGSFSLFFFFLLFCQTHARQFP
ncbi:MAG: hypothetical protein U5R30_10285 [Deltaproteobacteria bacterium]|nr:hypothetical protein [Deltaproteobacteria bacterium]